MNEETKAKTTSEEAAAMAPVLPLVSLRCWSCGKDATVRALPPQFGFELADLAVKVGWKAGHDFCRSRILIFCTERCMANAITKQGTFRLRPKAN